MTFPDVHPDIVVTSNLRDVTHDNQESRQQGLNYGVRLGKSSNNAHQETPDFLDNTTPKHNVNMSSFNGDTSDDILNNNYYNTIDERNNKYYYRTNINDNSNNNYNNEFTNNNSSYRHQNLHVPNRCSGSIDIDDGDEGINHFCIHRQESFHDHTDIGLENNYNFDKQHPHIDEYEHYKTQHDIDNNFNKSNLDEPDSSIYKNNNNNNQHHYNELDIADNLTTKENMTMTHNNQTRASTNETVSISTHAMKVKPDHNSTITNTPETQDHTSTTEHQSDTSLQETAQERRSKRWQELVHKHFPEMKDNPDLLEQDGGQDEQLCHQIVNAIKTIGDGLDHDHSKGKDTVSAFQKALELNLAQIVLPDWLKTQVGPAMLRAALSVAVEYSHM